MKSGFLKKMCLGIFCIAIAGVSSAQFDDIYFDPDEADALYAEVELDKYYEKEDTKSVKANDADKQYDYYYTSRIRRFDRPYRGFDFYAPVYVDPFYYNRFYSGFYRPNNSIYWSAGYARPVGFNTVYDPFNNVYVTSGWGYSAGGFYGGGSPLYGGGFYGNTGFPTYGGVGGGFAGGGFAGGGYNAYCPPAVGGIYSNPSTGVFRPSNTVSTSGPRGNITPGATTVYGPRGSSGSSNGSPRVNPRPGTDVNFPDRPLVESPSASPRSSQRTYTGAGTSRRDVSSASGPRTSRPVYTPPTRTTRSAASTRSSRDAYINNRPTRPTSTYSPSRTQYTSPRSTQRTYNSPSSTRSSSRSFSSPRSSSSSRSSGASRSSSGGSPRGNR